MKYLQKKKQERLYRQWTKHSDLPPEAVPKFDQPEGAGQEAADIPEDAEESGLATDSGYIVTGRDYRPARPEPGLEVGHNGRYLLEDRGLWYRFRALLVDLVRKILRVD
jgi:hypothetical protein